MHPDHLEMWVEFRKNEARIEPRPICCECGGEAEGDITCEDGDICEVCHAKAMQEEKMEG